MRAAKLNSPKASCRSGSLSALLLASLVMAMIGTIYLLTFRAAWPSPGSTAGLTCGVVGLVLMFAAETLYTLRKRLPRFSLGRMSTWLQMHIFWGLVGPFLIVLHSAGHFHGLAGAATIVMAVMVASGLVGRFLYTAAPRTLDGIEIDAGELLARFAKVEGRLRSFGVQLSAMEIATLGVAADLPGWVAVFGRPWLVWRQRRRVRQYVRRVAQLSPSATLELRQVLVDRFALQLDIHSLAAARRWLAWWHVLHVPLGWVLFTLVLIHVVAALSYRTL